MTGPQSIHPDCFCARSSLNRHSPGRTKSREKSRSEELVQQIESIPANISVVERSGRAIRAMYTQLKQDPSWGEDHGQLPDASEQPGFLDKVITLLSGKK
jgi:hypothetical protein